MKIINIMGSPRKNGTSSKIAKSFTDVAESRGASVLHYYLNGMVYSGCQGCESCHTRAEKCVLKDSLAQVFTELHQCDIAVFSSPVYFGDTSGQFKLFYDRMWSLVKPNFKEDLDNASRLAPGKTALFILSQVDVTEMHQDILERYSTYFELYGFNLKIIRATGINMEPTTDVSQYQLEAEQLARELVIE